MSQKIKIICPNCNAQLSANDSYAGRQLTCPKCRRDIVVPERTRLNDSPKLPDGSANAMTTNSNESNLEPLAPYPMPPSAQKTKGHFSTWLPTLLASVAIVFSCLQWASFRPSTSATSNEVALLTARIVQMEKDTSESRDSILKLMKDAQDRYIGDEAASETILKARLWRAQKAIDDAVELLGTTAKKAEAARIALESSRTPRRVTWPERSGTRIFETPFAEEEAKQIATAEKQFADEQRKQERAAAQKK